jgi:hypothetical protein
MTLASDRLAAVQRTGLHRIDLIYGPLAREAATVIPRLGLGSLPAILRRLEVLLIGAEPLLAAAIVATARDAELAADPKGPLDQLALATVGVTALESLRRNRPRVIGQAGRLLERGVNLGLTPLQTAQTVRQYLFRRDPASGLIASWPGRANMAGHHARGLLLFEATRGHARGGTRVAVRTGDLLRYHVSHKHLEIDECDVLERQDIGYGAGLYPPEAFPGVPRHINCRCWAEPAHRPRFLTLSESVPA